MNKQQSRFFGFSLLSVLMVTYLHYFSPTPDNKDAQETPKEAVQPVITSEIDKLKKKLKPHTSVKGDDHVLENEVMKVTLSEQGGHIKQVVLKQYKNYDGSPLVVLNHEHRIGMSLPHQGKTLHTDACVFETQHEEDGKISLLYKVDGSSEHYIKHTFSLDEDTYRVDCEVALKGISCSQDNAPTLSWYQPMKLLEKDASISRRETTLYYYQADRNKVTYLKANSKKEQKEEIKTPLGWVSANQKFFTSAVASATPFQAASLISNPIESEEEQKLLKELGMQLTLDAKALQKGSKLTFYFGPNKYEALHGIGPKFEENYYLGFTPVRQINKYLVVPATKYLEGYLHHYLLILLVFLLILTLLQLPFTYKAHLLEIKQKALEPMIAEIKERYQDDPLQAQMKEGQLKTKAGISLAGSFISAILQLPIFFTMMNFIRYNIGFRQASFLWMEDLSTYDSILQFPFRVPLLGAHLSLIALLASFVMLIPSWLKTRHKNTTTEENIMQYALPLVFFFALNSYSSAFNLYRVISQTLTLVPKSIFRLIIQEEPIQKEVLARLDQKETGSTTPRAQKRFAKRQKNKPS